MPTVLLPAVLLAALLFPGCTFISHANDWNGLNSPDGTPVHALTATTCGFQFLCFFPFLGPVQLDGTIDRATEQIRERGGDRVRLVFMGSSNYWWVLPPLSWLVTPVISEATLEYRPVEADAAPPR
jgi:hypothetical protein